MTDDEIIEVVRAHKEGKQIQDQKLPSSVWSDCGENPRWNFEEFAYRVKPKPLENLWLHNIGTGLWKEQPHGLGIHFVLDRSDASHLKFVESTTADLNPKEISPRKPREWWLADDCDVTYAYRNKRATTSIRVREVIEE